MSKYLDVWINTIMSNWAKWYIQNIVFQKKKDNSRNPSWCKIKLPAPYFNMYANLKSSAMEYGYIYIYVLNEFNRFWLSSL